jgi:hypothetical protein
MRWYLIEYLTERGDECVDLEQYISASNIKEALDKFNEQHKRITSIKET